MVEREGIYIPIDTFSTLIMSAIETYPTECSGLLFGLEDLSTKYIRYIVRSVIPYQIVVHRDETSIVEDSTSYLRLINSQNVVAGNTLLGGYHSHPDSSPLFSNSDKNYFKNRRKHQIELVLSIKKIMESNCEWEYYNDIIIEGSIPFGDQYYVFEIVGYYKDGNRIKRLDMYSGYIDVMKTIMRLIPSIHSLGDLYELSKNRQKSPFATAQFIDEIEDLIVQEESKKSIRAKVKELKEYLETSD